MKVTISPLSAPYALYARLCLMSCFESDEITITTVTKGRTLIDYTATNLSMQGYGMTKHAQGSHKKNGSAPQKSGSAPRETHSPAPPGEKKRRAKAKLKKDN